MTTTMMMMITITMKKGATKYKALQLASSFQTFAEGGCLTFLEKAARPITCFSDAQSWYSALTMFIA